MKALELICFQFAVYSLHLMIDGEYVLTVMVGRNSDEPRSYILNDAIKDLHKWSRDSTFDDYIAEKIGSDVTNKYNIDRGYFFGFS